jgi:hypothetical protein
MNKRQIKTASLLAFSALSEARTCTTAASARCCLETACNAVRSLTAADALSWALIGEIEATRAALGRNGWDCWPALIAASL